MYKRFINNKQRRFILVILVLILCISFFAILSLSNSNQYGSDDGESNGNLINHKTVIYENSQIEIYTLFPSSVINTDGGDQFVDNLASLEFKNISGTHIKRCEIHVDTEMGKTLTFVGEDIPNEMNVLAFETSNKSIDKEDFEKAFDCTVETDSTDVLLKDTLKISEEELEVEVKNISKNNLSNLVVTCHCVMDGVSYGGSKYDYVIPELKAGESATIYAEDCYFGEVKVVKVAVKQ